MPVTRQPKKDQKIPEMNNFAVRTLSGAVFLAVMVFCIIWDRMLFGALFLLVLYFALREFYAVSLGARFAFQQKLALLAGAAAFVLVCCHCFYGMKASYISLSLIPLLLIPMFSVFEGVREDFADLSMLYTGLLYIALPIALSPLIMMDGEVYDGWTMLSFFIVIWVSDVGAYCLGTLFGQKEGSRKLAPEISPKKSWWGFWSGLAFAFAAAAGLHFWLWADIPLVHCLVLGAIISVAGVCGDLFESQWKRHYHVKDSGSIIPGHGGMLDRFDSSLVAIPAAAVYLTAFGLL